MERPIIIFGAGQYGKMALEFYGSEAVRFFADNDPARAGTQYCGKAVLSFDEYLPLSPRYQTVIGTAAYAQIAEQLREAGVSDYIFYSPQFNKALDRIAAESRYLSGEIALYGIGAGTDILLSELRRRGISDEHIHLADEDGGDMAGKEFMGHMVVPLKQASSGASCIIISSENDSHALQVQAAEYGVKVLNPFMQRRYYETNELIFSPYSPSAAESTEADWNSRISRNRAIEILYRYTDELNRRLPLFCHVEIETVNRCNGVCSFCPVSAGNDIREKKVMSVELYERIINQLADLNYTGRLATFSNNEPFLDTRMVDFNEFARRKLPDARIHLYTNGTLLGLDTFIAIIPFLDELIIDNYDQELNLIPNSETIREYCERNPELKEKVTIVLRKPNEILTSRGGDAPNRNEKLSFPDARCALPFKQMIVRPDGKLSLCCNDAYGKNTLGDLESQSLLEAWYGEGYAEARQALMIGRKAWPQCRQCDVFSLL